MSYVKVEIVNRSRRQHERSISGEVILRWILLESLPIRVGVVLAAGIFATEFATLPPFAQAEVDPRIEALALETRQWAQSVDFACTFRHDTGRSSTLEKGLALEWSDDSIRHGASGVLAKRGSMIRHSYVYDEDPVFQVNGDQITGSFVSFEEVFTPQWIVSNWLDYPDFPSLLLRPREPYQPGETTMTSLMFRGMTNPLSIKSIPATDILNIPGGAKNVRGDVERLDNSRLVVTVSYGAESHTSNLKLVFWTEPEVSVVERCDWTYVGSDGLQYRQVELRSDFVQCVGGVVPSTIVTANRSGNSENGLWRTGRWHSADLGESLISGDAFKIQLTEGTHVINVRNAHEKCIAGRLDCTQLTVEDYRPKVRFVFSQQSDAGKQQFQGLQWRMWLIILAITILIAIFIGAMRYRRAID